MEMKYKNFAVFILTHGRPDNLITLKSLNKSGYTGKVYFIVDNEDKRLQDYYDLYGTEKVIMFDKKYYADNIDEGNNFDERRTITHARNACFDIAEKLGLDYFIQLDDDYTSFLYRNENEGRTIKRLNEVFDNFIDFYKTANIKSIAFSQGGDHIGGYCGNKLLRKCMNSFLCSTKRRFRFIGAMNEDVNTYTTLGSRGELFFTFTGLQLNQMQTQSQQGGITDMYLRYGTYCKAFTTCMMMPSSVRVSSMGKDRRIHHRISWKNTTPCIIRSEIKKN